jgi:immunoglobulin-binding protein 1
MDEDPRSLKATYDDAEQRRAFLEGSYEASSPTYRNDLEIAVKDYEACLKMIYKLGVFSPNEGVEDISTTDLPFLLVGYYLAELVQKISTTTPHDRRVIIERAREYYEQFLGQLDNYSILTEPYAKLYSNYTDDTTSFSTISTTDAATRRNAKIANFKAEKQLKVKLETLQKSPRYLEHGDEEIVREIYLANIAFCTHMAFQGLEGINREIDVLAQATVPLLPQNTSVEVDERRRAEDLKTDGYSERLDQPLKRLQSMFNGQSGPLLSKEGKPLQPFTIVGTRQDIQKGVFRPGHNLPTMSIDEYLEEEKRRGGIIEGGGEASYRREEPDEDNIEKADAETMKAREWDDFTEDNPRGAGNTLNRG